MVAETGVAQFSAHPAVRRKVNAVGRTSLASSDASESNPPCRWRAAYARRRISGASHWRLQE